MSKWRSVDTAPIGERVLISDEMYGSYVASKDQNNFWWADGYDQNVGEVEFKRVTHWMPLPKDPPR